MIEIRETTEEDIKCVQELWADGDVMRFVGFPDGLHKTYEEMQDWLRWIESNRPERNHYSIFEDGKYCGESFYDIDRARNSAALDIKLFAFARSMKRFGTVLRQYGSIRIRGTQKRSRFIRSLVFSIKNSLIT